MLPGLYFVSVIDLAASVDEEKVTPVALLWRDPRAMRNADDMSKSSVHGTEDTAPSIVEFLEPDYRFTLANERTFLAWLRTGLGLLAAGVGFAHFVPAVVLNASPHFIGAGLAFLAALTIMAGLRRWRTIDDAMRRRGPLPAPRMPVFLSRIVALIGLAIAFLLLMSIGVH
ncbi:MAG: YidH family protein [Mycobacterium sp.]